MYFSDYCIPVNTSSDEFDHNDVNYYYYGNQYIVVDGIMHNEF